MLLELPHTSTSHRQFCPQRNANSGDAYEGSCLIRYSYADDRGLATYEPGARDHDGMVGRNNFELTWMCQGQGSTRSCEVTDAIAEYTVEINDLRANRYESGRYLPTAQYHRTWRVPLSIDGGSVTLPAFWACGSGCNCASFPSLTWDVVNQE